MSNDSELSSRLILVVDPDRLEAEHDYLMQQKMMLSKSSTLNELVTFKKELDKSERQREQLSDHLEVSGRIERRSGKIRTASRS